MSNKMLIDASHPEETRVVVLRGNRVEEFDFEAADRQQLRGNIYLAKVTRVEPSLQAAFVEYGGNRHGFLAFSEIHPDYYQIPFADRQALLQEHAREEEEEAAEEEAAEQAEARQAGQDRDPADAAPEPAGAFAESRPDESVSEAADADGASEGVVSGPDGEPVHHDHHDHHHDDHDHHEHHDHDDTVESVGAEDALEEVPERRKPRPRQYKIQEVIKRRQVLLVQVVKEERGNKGAALTTYLSLAGRYSVLMPNTGRGGGISRKITNPADRKRLKEIAGELEVPEGMGVILRTAGANRTKAEVKRDFEYLLRLWENVRELTLRSTAPKLVYEEGSLIKRSIRDLYSREIDEVVVAGDDAYREAKDFMRMLMPSHAKNVQQYRDPTPIFSRNGVEAQLDAMFSPQVTLRSGGYIVINQTEALVSIDVNSGRSTREHSIEDTALNTNLEAAEEIARQLRLRDLAGLIVIDFIDMEEKRNNRSVERKMKDCLRADRARIQVGRISHFGLMEMSRQRIRTGVLESSTVLCQVCHGTGQVRSISSLSLQILRALEDHLLRNSGHHLLVRSRPDVALYVLNQKRRHLAELEERFGLSISVSGEAPENGAGFSLERGEPAEPRPERPASRPIAMIEMDEPEEEIDEVEEVEDEALEPVESGRSEERSDDGDGRERRPRRRRRRGEGRQERGPAPVQADAPEREGSDEEPEGEAVSEGGVEARPGSAEDDQGADARRRRRGRRGGRRRGRNREGEGLERPAGEAGAEGDAEEGYPEEGYAGGETEDRFVGGEEAGDEAFAAHEGFAPAGDEPEAPYEREPAYADAPVAEAPELPPEEPADAYAEEIAAVTEAAPQDEAPVEAWQPEPQPALPTPEPVRPLPAPEPRAALPEPEPVAALPAPPAEEDNRPKRSGWWSRKSFF
jgi:ribonuclease E